MTKKRRKSSIFSIALLLLAFALAIPFRGEAELCYDLNDNSVPDGWEVNLRGNAGIANGRLEAQPVDGFIQLFKDVNEPMEEVKVSFDGFINDSFWGAGLDFRMFLSNGDVYNVNHANEGYEFGDDNYAFIGSSTVSGGYMQVQRSPEQFVEYHHEAIFRDGTVSFKVFRKSDSSLVFDLSTPAPALDLELLSRIQFTTGFNTGSGTTWMDNICVDLVPANPVSATCVDFEDNMVPEGWVSNTWGNATIQNGRIEVQAVDGRYDLDYVLPEPVSSIHTEFDGHIQDSYWTSYIRFTIFFGDGTEFNATYANETYEYGNDNHAYIGFWDSNTSSGSLLGVERHPEKFVDYRVVMDVTDGEIHMKVQEKDTQVVVIDMVVNDSNIAVNEIVKVGYRTGFNTGSGVTWMDNICLDTTPANDCFTDDFSGDLAAYDIYGNWYTQNGELIGHYDHGCGSVGCPQADLVLKDGIAPTGDFEASVDFIKTTYLGGYLHQRAHGSFSVWDASNRRLSIGIGAGGFGEWGGVQEVLHVSVETNNGLWNRIEYAALPINWNMDEWNKATLVRVGNQYSLKLNDQEVYAWTDTFLNGVGRVGLHVYGSQRFDNFTVCGPDKQNDNNPPVAACHDITVSLNNQGVATLSPADIDAGSYDPDGDALILSLDVDSVNCPDIGARQVTLTVTDSHGDSDSCTALVTVVDTVLPEIISVSGPTGPVEINSEITMLASAFDACGIVSTEWHWGDGTFESGFFIEETGEFAAFHAYANPGVYTVEFVAVDEAGNVASQLFQYVVVYDPEGGFVTGGGWIQSPAGAYILDSTLTGKANFGFVAKYKKGTTIPSGHTEFRFKAGDLDFKSIEYQWLVVAGANAKYKGVGSINGDGVYGFMVTATDGDLNGGNQMDAFRIKIWDALTEVVVYDNKMGVSDDASDAQELGGGNIVIHK